MKHNKGVGFGIFLLTVGILWVLWNAGIISWSIVNSLFILWPLILVVIGVSIIFRRNSIIRAVAWLAFLAVLVSYSYITDNKAYGNETRAGNNIKIEKTSGIEKGELRIAFGGTNIELDSNTLQILEATLQDPDIKLSKNITDNNALVIFKKQDYQLFKRDISKYKNQFHLNSDMIWDLNIDTGAVNSTFDLTQLKIENLNVNTGAANMKFKFGSKSNNTSAKINAGVSKIELDVPKTTGVRIKMEGGLNSNNFDNNEWDKRDGYYYSKGYDQATSKLDLNVVMGVGKFEVNLF